MTNSIKSVVDKYVKNELSGIENPTEKFIDRVFDDSQPTIPTLEEWSKYILFDHGHFNFDVINGCNSFMARSKYNSRIFPLVTHEFLIDLVDYVKKFNIVCDIACGIGQLTHWIRKYGGHVEFAVDDDSWPDRKPKDYFDFVEKQDAIEFVKNHPEIDLYLLSWPYMSDMAANIWKNMRTGQTLLYIGESEGGCTANDEFFKCVSENNAIEVDDKLNKNFMSFWGIHDRIYIFKK